MTGSDGYIGSHLKPYLENKGYTVTPYQGDICDFDIDVDDFPDMIIHLAALTGVRKSFDNAEEYGRVNIEGTRAVFSVAKEHFIPTLFASSSNALEVTNPYAETKFINEQDRIPNSVGFRPHTVYPGRPDMLYQRLLKGEVDYINEGHYRDFTHIDDLCSALFTLVENYDIMAGKVVDIGSGKAVPVKEVASAMGYTGAYSNDPTPHERAYTHANIEPLTELGWKPEKYILNEIRNS